MLSKRSVGFRMKCGLCSREIKASLLPLSCLLYHTLFLFFLFTKINDDDDDGGLLFCFALEN
jgi:hypothetical protein